MAEYINREALIQYMEDCKDENAFTLMATGYAYAFIEEVPACDVVSQAVFDQVKWERDTALATLKEHGIGLAEKADVVEVVRCKDCKHSKIDNSGTTICILNSECDAETGVDYGFISYCSENHFCSYGERITNND